MKIIPRLLLLATLGLSISSCDKFINGYDVNPNAAQDAPADQQLTAVEVAQGLVLSGETPRTAGIWIDFFTGADRQYEGLQNYTTNASSFDAMWANSYELVMNNARLVEAKATAVQNNQLLGIAQVIEAHQLGTVASLWGDVPYSQAFVPGQPPKYDAQTDVYASAQTLLDQAIANLGKNGVSPKARDIIYNGDVTKWQAAAHTLKARYFLHVKNYTQAVAQAKLGIGSAAGDMLMPYHGNPTTDANPYWDFTQNNRTGYMTADGAYAVSLLTKGHNNAKTNEAGRFKYFYVTPGDFGTVDPNYNSGGAFAADAYAPLATYVETQAILAESLLKQATPDQAGALTALNSIRTYNAGKFKGGKYDAYTTADFASAADLLKEVLTEKYLSLIGQIEPFNDVRRTKNLIGVPKKKADAPSIPQRYLYSQNEVNTNPNTPQPIPGLYDTTPVNKTPY